MTFLVSSPQLTPPFEATNKVSISYLEHYVLIFFGTWEIQFMKQVFTFPVAFKEGNYCSREESCHGSRHPDLEASYKK